eukprot:jgi/Ulvmu1/2772/UM014_0230.1
MGDGYVLRVEDSLRKYLHEIADVLEDGQADVELVISGVLEEVKGRELKIATDMECSRFLEKVVSRATPAQALDMCRRIASRDTLYTIACNPFGSHVLEGLLLQVQEALATESSEDAYEVIEHIVQLIKDDLIDYITHKYATFLARRLLQLLVGKLSSVTVSKPDSGGKKQDIAHKVQALRERVDSAPNNSQPPLELAVDPKLKVHVDAFVNVIAGPGFADSMFDLQRSSYGSPFLQALLNAPLAPTQHERMLCQMLGIMPGEKENLQSALNRLNATTIMSQMKHKTASHTIEAAFLNCPSSMYSAVWSCLKPKFASLCLNPISNFAAQALISAAPAACYIGCIFQEVRSSLTDVITRGRSGVACVLTSACAAWGVECEACCRAIEETFAERVIPALATLGLDLSLAEAAEQAGKRPLRLSVNGCIILQALLGMPQTACAKISDSILALPSVQLGFLAKDPSGARVLEAMLMGSAPKSLKRKMLVSLKPHYVKMAQLGSASRFVEALFTWGTIADKEVVVHSLTECMADVQGSKYGAILCETFMTELYRSSADSWRRRMEASEKMRMQYEKLFGDCRAGKSKASRNAKRKCSTRQKEGVADKHAHSSHAADVEKRQPADAAALDPTACEETAVADQVVQQLGIGRHKSPKHCMGLLPHSASVTGRERLECHVELQSKKRKRAKSRVK